MRFHPDLAAALVLAAALAGCGGSDGAAAGPSPRTACHYGNYCNEYEGPHLDVSSTNATCSRSGATVMAVCPQEGVLGLCTRLRDSTTTRGYHYDAATLDPVRRSCVALGDTWTTP